MEKEIEKLILEAQNGDKKSLEEIILNNEGLIWSVLKKYLNKGYDKDDLYQICAIGFIKAIKRFDFSFNVKLSTYAVEYMSGEIKKFIRDDGIIKISRYLKELSFKINELEKNSVSKTGKVLDIKALSKILDVSENEIMEAKRIINNVRSLNEENEEGKEVNLIDKIVLEDDEEQNKIVDRIMLFEEYDLLSRRDRMIINLRYFKEKTQTQVASVLGISQVQVSRLERKILNKLRESLAW